MKCGRCRREISRVEARTAVIRFDNGKVKEALHRKCAHIQDRQALLEKDGRRDAESKSAYEVSQEHRNADDLTQEARAALARRQEEIAEQRELEPNDDQWDDFRGPTELEI